MTRDLVEWFLNSSIYEGFCKICYPLPGKHLRKGWDDFLTRCGVGGSIYQTSRWAAPDFARECKTYVKGLLNWHVKGGPR